MPLYFNWRKEFCKVKRCQWEKGSSFSISIYDGLKKSSFLENEESQRKRSRKESFLRRREVEVETQRYYNGR